MITVAEAEKIILSHVRDFGEEAVDLKSAIGRVLAENIDADRDLPPYDRVTMDGFAIKYSDFTEGQRTFPVQFVQAAGEPPKRLMVSSCIQVMTGAVLPYATDTVVPVEDTKMDENDEHIITIQADKVDQGQYIHRRGSDVNHSQALVPGGQILSAAAIALAASVGRATVPVRKLPKIAIVTTGDEVVDIKAKPSDYQIRQSNNYAINAALDQLKATAAMLHVSDDVRAMKQLLKGCLEQYDVIILSGGVSKGNFDFVPSVLSELSVEILFHGVKQKPGKPLLFGVHPNGPTIFACPGNPVSATLCIYKYFLPWLRLSLSTASAPPLYAILDRDILSPTELNYFVQVKLYSAEDGILYATPIVNNGSGDFLSLLQADAFLELPSGKRRFKKGEAYKMIVLRTIR